MNPQNSFINHYKVLGFNQIVAIDEVKKAYRILAKHYHPDINPSLVAQEKMKSVNAAYEILGSHHLKSIYDKQFMQYLDDTASTIKQPNLDNFSNPKYDNFTRFTFGLLILVLLKVCKTSISPSNTNNNYGSFKTEGIKEAEMNFQSKHYNLLVNHEWVRQDSLANEAFLRDL